MPTPDSATARNRVQRPKLVADSPRGRAVAVLLEQAPSTQRGIFRRAFSGRSVAAALKAKCLECCCFDRAEIRDCLVLACPLWAYRPFQVAEAATAGEGR